MKLTLFYDSYCPLCATEMDMLRELDTKGNLSLVDIHDEDFSTRFPTIDPVEADRVLHGLYDDGTMIFGLDVTHHAWRAVGRKPWLAILRWPVVRWFADMAYLVFANNRYLISWFLTGKKRSEPCAKNSSSQCGL